MKQSEVKIRLVAGPTAVHCLTLMTLRCLHSQLQHAGGGGCVPGGVLCGG